MTAQTPTLSVDAIDAALAAATPGLDGGGRRLAAAVLRLLAAGDPVGVPAAAAAAGMPASRAGPGCSPASPSGPVACYAKPSSQKECQGSRK